MRLLGVCIEPTNVCALLEFADRGSLDQVLIAKEMTFSSHLLRMLEQVARALAFMHASDLVHNDVKVGLERGGHCGGRARGGGGETNEGRN